MSRVLFVEPEEYSELEVSLQEAGIEYDRATRDEAGELFSRIDYDGVVGPENADLYQFAAEEDVPYLAFNSFGTNFTDVLSGSPDVDADRIDHYLNTCPDENADLFLSLLRHDAGNDLNVAMGYAELLEEETGSEEHDKYWRVLKDKLRSIEELLETSNVVSSLSDNRDQVIGLNRCLENAMNDYDSLANEEGIDITIEADDAYQVEAGPLLDDMYGQIIENGINHSEGSQIDISLTGNERTARVDIEDDGKGIPEDVREDVLKKGITNGETGNTGIGLFLVSKIADNYDIHLDIGESEELGGARFTTIIPRKD